MALELPQLGQKEYNEIVEDLVRTIPKYSKDWTNYNPSEPGIIMLEAFAYLADHLMYSVNQLPLKSYLHYMRRVAGVIGIKQARELLTQYALENDDGVDRHQVDLLNKLIEIEEKYAAGLLTHDDVPDMKGAVVKFVKSRYRAVTEGDYHELLLEVTEDDDVKIVRSFMTMGTTKYDRTIITIVLDEVNPYSPIIFEPTPTQGNSHYPAPDPSPTSTEKVFPRGFSYRYDPALDTTVPSFNPPAGSNILQLPLTRDDFDTFTYTPRTVSSVDYNTVIYKAEDYLEPRRLVGSKLEIIKPVYTSIEIDMILVCGDPYRAEKAIEQVIARFQEYLDPVKGGPEKEGWPYGRTFSIHEAYHLIESIDEVDVINELQFNNATAVNMSTEGLFDLSRISVRTLEE